MIARSQRNACTQPARQRGLQGIHGHRLGQHLVHAGVQALLAIICKSPRRQGHHRQARIQRLLAVVRQRDLHAAHAIARA